jgi:hypothetical protein
MNRTGVLQVQSHTMTHALYFKNNTIIDFRHPEDPYIWMTWNNHPEKKPFLQIDNEKLIAYGEPVYAYQKALEGKRYFPDPKLTEYLITTVKEMGGKQFFSTPDWKTTLIHHVESYKKENELTESYETDEDYRKRIIYELKESKEIIEKQLNTSVNFLCWPIGAATPQTVEISKEIGYISSTVASDMKREERRSRKNTFGEDPTRIYRIGAGLHRRGKKGYQYNNGWLFVLSLYDFQEKTIMGTIGKILLTIVTKI